MNEVANETKTTVMTDTSTVQKKIETIIFNTLKDRIRGHIYARMEEKENEKDDNTLFINISNFGVKYTDRLTLPGDTFEMVAKSDSYAETLGLMIYDNFKKYLETVFFIQDKPKKYNEKYKSTKRFEKKS